MQNPNPVSRAEVDALTRDTLSIRRHVLHKNTKPPNEAVTFFVAHAFPLSYGQLTTVQGWRGAGPNFS